MIEYRVGEKKFYNWYLAQHQSMTTGDPVTFYCHDDLYDRFDWSCEPEQSLDELMKSHAENLRNRYERLVLLYSGGTDSHTIYNIFVRNNIHLDEIIVKSSKSNPGLPLTPYQYLKNHHHDKTTILTQLDSDDVNLRKLDIQDENWLLRDCGDLSKFELTLYGDVVKFLCEKNHNGHSWIAIVGHEKPYVFFRDNKWYSSMNDSILRPTMGHAHLESFFLEPLINIKQSHLCMKAAKIKFSEKQTQIQGSNAFLPASDLWMPDRQGYRDLAFACGRHPELSDTVSITQKLFNEKFSEISVQGNTIDYHDKRLRELHLAGDPLAKRFIDGFKLVQSEKSYVEFLNEFCLTKQNKFRKTKPILSKPYFLADHTPIKKTA